MQPNDNNDHQSGSTNNPEDRPHTEQGRRSKRRPTSALFLVSLLTAGLTAGIITPTAAAQPEPPVSSQSNDLIAAVLDESRSLDGSGNNVDNATLGQAGQIYPRVGEANYADGIGEMVTGPAERYLSNRIFNDTNQNIFSENGVTHWGFVWGQFLDHTIGLREDGDEDLIIGFDPTDPLEDFTNDLGGIATTRTAIADGTGTDSPREQVNTVSSYIDGWAVYGGSDTRLDWLRDGTVDGDPTNNEATLINEGGYLPTAAAREGVDAPSTDLMGRLFAHADQAVIAGDVRVNENIGLTAAHTLFLREHNRIVDALPDDLDEETKFQIARRIVGALQQYITYNEFLPAMGVHLDVYNGYDSNVDPSITSEFATVGYRAHSQIHGEFEAEIPLDQLTASTRQSLDVQGIEVDIDEAAGIAGVAIPLNVAFGNPALVQEVGLGNLLTGLSSEAAYANDGQIDNQLRSVLFQIPGPQAENPLNCLDGAAIADCFSGVNDLGSLDVARAYDHGMPSYNELRIAYGLAPVTSFTDMTGEPTDDLGGLSIDDPAILELVLLEDGDGNILEIGSAEADGETIVAERRTTAAARLAAIFDAVDDVDAFTGMVSEPHIEGTEFGELQLAMWQTQFAALRDGDRFFYGNDPILDQLTDAFGIDYRRTLAEIIVDNTTSDPATVPANVFLLTEAPVDAATKATTEPESSSELPPLGAATPATIESSTDPNPNDAEARPALRTRGDGTMPGERPRRPNRPDRDHGRLGGR